MIFSKYFLICFCLNIELPPYNKIVELLFQWISLLMIFSKYFLICFCLNIELPPYKQTRRAKALGLTDHIFMNLLMRCAYRVV